jgi:hypothetical protein
VHTAVTGRIAGGKYIMHDENEILAVISAAVAMLNATPEVKLVVRSYRRVNQTSPVWNTIGREEIVSSRL